MTGDKITDKLNERIRMNIKVKFSCHKMENTQTTDAVVAGKNICASIALEMKLF